MCYIPNIDVFYFFCLGGFTHCNKKIAIKQVDKGKKYHRKTSDEGLAFETSVSYYFYDVLWKFDPY